MAFDGKGEGAVDLSETIRSFDLKKKKTPPRVERRTEIQRRHGQAKVVLAVEWDMRIE
jgi:hypothetical protein